MTVSDELYNLMEDVYSRHGASSNGAQLQMRYNHLNYMVDKYGEERTKFLLENYFYLYHTDYMQINFNKYDLNRRIELEYDLSYG